GLKRRVLFRSERHLVASPAYVATMPPPAAPADIAAQQCRAYAPPRDPHVWRRRAPCGAHGIALEPRPAANHGPVAPAPARPGVEEIAIAPRHVANNGMVLLARARLGEGIALLDDYTVAPDVADGSLVRLMPDHVVTNTTFDEGMFATILDTAMIPAKIRLFL